MLAIRMQRTGRSGHASFKVVVQDSRKSPFSGKIVAYIGNYDPHTKATLIEKDKAEFYLTRGAHPSERVAVLLKQEGVKLPAWVLKSTKKSKKIRHPEKLRRNRPADAKAMADKPDEPVAPVAAEEAPSGTPTTEVADTTEMPANGTPVEDTKTEVTDKSEAVDEPAEIVAPESTEPTENISTEAAAETEIPSVEPTEQPAETEAEVTGEISPESPIDTAKPDK